jgi:presenilin-like A22 family membrane protease
MKHTLKIVAILLGMFLITQLIGLAVVHVYASNNDNLPYGMEPPKDLKPETSLFSIIFAIVIAVALMLLLMSLKIEFFLRLWFFFVVVVALGITINAALMGFSYASYIAIALALPLAILKVFKRNILVHNLTELLIYPGIAVIFVPLLNVWTISLLLVLISVYDIYAVWHSGIMQKMAKYQIKQLKVFSGFFVPYFGKKEKELITKAQNSKSAALKGKKLKLKLNLAILGGGDVVFPIIFSGVVFRAMGLVPALITTLTATLALAFLFYISKKGKFYPAMPFISAGCFIGLALASLLAQV